MALLLAVFLPGSVANADPAMVPNDGGVNTCKPSGPPLDIGNGTQQSARSFSDDFRKPRPDLWCSYRTGTSQLNYGSDGATLKVPPTSASRPQDQSLPLFGDNAEFLSYPAFETGMTMSTTVNGAPDLLNLNGTAGWGITNRTLDVLNLDMSWFAWWGADGPAKRATDPVVNLVMPLLVDTPNPRRLVVMNKRAGSMKIDVRQLDQKLFAGTHDYSIALGKDSVNFRVDGKSVARFDNQSKRSGAGTGQPRVFQIWMDHKDWPIVPLPDYNKTGHELTISSYSQAPSK
ncbi:hypothetical protein L5I01_13150 [Gordonia sp. HY442]|uniref:hypothetical protein n=1 Tax=Gordonia zhenghanii TaxID=2911516 RepID=UPI001F2743C3|nr:hypothetical protein [Gordonia zhenghanii]MCF8604300.1 hypothetical protein [Gordonia zhenghanii]